MLSVGLNLTDWRLGDWLAGLTLGLGTWAWVEEHRP